MWIWCDDSDQERTVAWPLTRQQNGQSCDRMSKGCLSSTPRTSQFRSPRRGGADAPLSASVRCIANLFSHRAIRHSPAPFLLTITDSAPEHPPLKACIGNFQAQACALVRLVRHDSARPALLALPSHPVVRSEPAPPTSLASPHEPSRHNHASASQRRLRSRQKQLHDPRRRRLPLLLPQSPPTHLAATPMADLPRQE